MRVFKSKHKDITYIQIYLTKDELLKEETQEKINNIKGKNIRIAMFVSGNNDYSKILEKIIISEVENINGL